MKEYGTIQPFRHVGIIVNLGGHNIEILFDGGQSVPRWRPAKYKTSDARIQKAIESHPHFGSQFELLKEVKDTPQPAMVTKNPVVTDDNPTINKIAEGIHNGQEARAYLNKRYEVPYSDMPNVIAIKEIASRHNITFPDWK